MSKEPRDSIIAICVTESERAELIQRANDADRSISSYCRLELFGGSRPKPSTKRARPTPRGYPVDGAFDEFWIAYPRKVGKAKALAAWRKLNPPIAQCLRVIGAQKKSEAWRKDQGQFIPHPTTWLNEGRWDDEVEDQSRPKRFVNRPVG